MRRVFRLPNELRATLAQPLGRVYKADEVDGDEFRELVKGAPMVATVGDRVTDTLQGLGRTPDVQVVDGVERRARRDPPAVPFARLLDVENPAGTLTAEAVEAMAEAFGGKKPARVMVKGEEDLMAMLAIAMAPESTLVFYGQPGVGVVAVRCDADSRARNKAILAKMGIRGIHRPSS